jgi:hypothetical protein
MKIVKKSATITLINNSQSFVIFVKSLGSGNRGYLSSANLKLWSITAIPSHTRSPFLDDLYNFANIITDCCVISHT